ncbi:MAG: alginate export family protein [Thiohalospira sp.]
MKKNILGLTLIFLSITSYAQFLINAEYRPRFEFRDGYNTFKTAETNPAAFITQRTRLNLSHTYHNITSKISVQDFRIWGESTLKNDEPGLSIFEAYFQLQLNEKWAVTAGRQAFDIDDKRLFSIANWNQVSNSHDGVMLDFDNNAAQFKMFTAFNQAKASNFGIDYSENIQNYKFLNLIWFEKSFDNTTIANLTITDGYQKEGTTNTDYYRFTTGLIFKYQKSKQDLQLRGFYQTGKTNIGQDVSAYYFSSKYMHKVGSKFNFTGGVEYKSGNDQRDNTNTKDNAFDILYGARHGFNGMMDYFSIPTTTKKAGLFDGYLKAKINFNPKLNISIDYHYFSLTNNYIYNNEVQDKFLAHEFDLTGNLNINKFLNLQLGYGMLFGSKTLERIRDVDSDGIQQFFYTMITVTPEFFKHE